MLAFLYAAVRREFRVEPTALLWRAERCRLEVFPVGLTMPYYRGNWVTKCFSGILIFESSLFAAFRAIPY